MNLKNFLIILILCLPLLARNHYWNWNEDMYELYESPEQATLDSFLKSYFYKPLKRLKKATGEIHVLSLQRVEDLKKICKTHDLQYDAKHDRCVNNSGKVARGVCFPHPKNTKDMEKYFLNSKEYPSDPEADQYGLSFEDIDCSYKGKVEIFGHTWDFISCGGKTKLTRKISPSEKRWSLEENAFQAYKQGLLGIDYKPNKAGKYLVCRALSCHPRAIPEVH
ncbi:hypothetical protein [Helicobacter suis]|uniref:hypothetical protein n=1 Tax=Helicobacter suis TaxID=104628 RepID=UPI0013D60C05|nr:hypothetical protein [Helicobacter suis]